ncbi:MGDG synthase family glycosyltransferase [Oceanobacillus kimchii]|uniref:Glycosyltransferase YkoN n=1 Tax=Oceanobacillus kimchii TaxID=746691 RepID=A0ABQ5TGR3_9BACI|nr:glycosyltransferase [Oceanobacillus kimchii]GLO66054.1 putative glycosyltransferase YkoN [Oceanobacillus kimchii]
MKSNNGKALFLPFMQIPTGHHHVAEALMDELNKSNHSIQSEKVDILAYSYGKLERIVSSTYLLWIRFIPHTYNWMYDQVANSELTSNRKILFEFLFLSFFKRLIKETKPEILFCTHALPSYLAGRLKSTHNLSAIIVNVYTDYFVNNIWGIDGIDYHIVPSVQVKFHLMRKGVKEQNIFVTGIPVHGAFYPKPIAFQTNKINILVTGGSLGIGDIDELLPHKSSLKNLHYYVLCGKNKRLYETLKNRRNIRITPIPYINNKQEMNRIYDKVDAVLTKPGGVTVSECLKKKKVIFISNTLPGQERINLDQLKYLGLVIPINLHNQTVENQIVSFFSSKSRRRQYQANMKRYHSSLENKSMIEILDLIIKK